MSADFTRYKVVDVAATSGSPLSTKTVVTTGPARLFGIYVNTVLSNHTLPIEDDADESPQLAATTVVTLPAQAAAGSMYSFPGIEFTKGLVVNGNAAGTGSITVAYKEGTARTLNRVP